MCYLSNKECIFRKNKKDSDVYINFLSMPFPLKKYEKSLPVRRFFIIFNRSYDCQGI